MLKEGQFLVTASLSNAVRSFWYLLPGWDFIFMLNFDSCFAAVVYHECQLPPAFFNTLRILLLVSISSMLSCTQCISFIYVLWLGMLLLFLIILSFNCWILLTSVLGVVLVAFVLFNWWRFQCSSMHISKSFKEVLHDEHCNDFCSRQVACHRYQFLHWTTVSRIAIAVACKVQYVEHLAHSKAWDRKSVV